MPSTRGSDTSVSFNAQFIRRDENRIARKEVAILPRYMTETFNQYAQACAWLGGPCGLAYYVDGYVNMLRDFQVGNAGIAQVIARHEDKCNRPQEEDTEFCDDCVYDSDDSMPTIAEREDWYPFDQAAEKVRYQMIEHLTSIACRDGLVPKEGHDIPCTNVGIQQSCTRHALYSGLLVQSACPCCSLLLVQCHKLNFV